MKFASFCRKQKDGFYFLFLNSRSWLGELVSQGLYIQQLLQPCLKFAHVVDRLFSLCLNDKVNVIILMVVIFPQF